MGGVLRSIVLVVVLAGNFIAAWADVPVSRKESRYEQLQSQAAKGDVAALLEIGRCYKAGRGTERNPKSAYAAFLKAAEAGSVQGMYETANCLLSGVGVSEHPATGMKWLRKAAENNHREAIAEMTEQCLRQYLGTANNRKQAEEVRRWSEKGASMGIAYCRRILGGCYQYGVAMTADPKQAFQCYSQAFRDGDADAAVNLALCHRDGVGTPRDEKKALLILQKAATISNPVAIYQFAANLDELVVKGRASKRLVDPIGLQKRAQDKNLHAEYKKEVVRQLERAVKLENTDAMNLLVIKKFLGQGCTKDMAAAYELAMKSEKAGNRDGICLLGECFEHGIGTTPNPRRAASLFGRAAKMGSAIAQYRFGLCLAFGFGMPANFAAGRQWMVMSSTNGCQAATEFLREVAEHEQAQLREYQQYVANVNKFMAGMGDIIESGLDRQREEFHRIDREGSQRMEERDRVRLQ